MERRRTFFSSSRAREQRGKNNNNKKLSHTFLLRSFLFLLITLQQQVEADPCERGVCLRRDDPRGRGKEKEEEFFF